MKSNINTPKMSPEALNNSEQKVSHVDNDPWSGLTKREYFATLAMQGLIANAPNGQLNNSYEGCSLAVQWADELLNELEKKRP